MLKYVLTVLLFSTAVAEAPVTFGPASYCPTYCTGFVTSDPSVTLDYVMFGQVGLSVNGVVYRNSNARAYDSVLSVLSATYPLHSIHQVTNVPYQSADGRIITATIVYDETVSVVNSGRAHGYLKRDTVLGGSLQ
jgi:hypothetical protein